MVQVHVNMHVIRRNQKTGEREPPLTVIRGKLRERGHSIEIHRAVQDRLLTRQAAEMRGAGLD